MFKSLWRYQCDHMVGFDIFGNTLIVLVFSKSIAFMGHVSIFSFFVCFLIFCRNNVG